MPASDHPHVSLGDRAKHEITQYAVITLYLYVCFAALIFYKWSILQAHGIGYTAYGLAAIKALIMAKFMLIGHAVGFGEKFRRSALIYPVLYRSSVFLVMLLLLNIVEALVRGFLHDHTVRASLSELGGGTWAQILAVCFLMWLILLPYFAFRTLGEILGKGELRRMFLTGADRRPE